MNLWTALIYGAAALLAISFFYVLLRWRRSPMAVRGMAYVAGLCFLSGALSGIWLFHVASQLVEPKIPPATTTSPAATAFQSIAALAATPRAPLQATPRAAPSVAAPASKPSPAPSAAPAKVTISTVPAPTDWVARVNFYRGLAKIPSVAEDPRLSAADQLHARYLVKNRVPPDSRMHNEDPSNRWFTTEGLAAARASDVIDPCAGCAELSPAQAIDWWVAAPFHRLSILNPALNHIGYGEFREDGMKANVINIGEVSFKTGVAAPVMFPGDATIVSLNAISGEWPDPLSGCPGFRPPSGLPATLALGLNVEAVVEQHRFSEDGRALEHCVFDASSYTNPDASAQQWGKNILKGFGGVVVIPRLPLVAGHRYTVDLLVSGREYGWSFSVER